MNVINWVLAHQALVAALAVAVIDFVIAVVPSVASNGILHGIYLFLKGKAAPAA